MALDFDGTDDDVTIGDVAAIDITGSNLTLSAWFIQDIASGTYFLIAKRNLGVSIQYGLYVDVDVLRIETCDGGTTPEQSGVAGVATGSWQHGGGVRKDDGTLTAWLNGTPDSTPTSVSQVIGNTTNALKLGEAGSIATDNEFPLNGKMCEAAIWDVALSNGEMTALAKGVSPLLVRRNSLKGYWPLWSTGHLMDLSGNGNPGTLTGAVNYAHTPVMPLLNFVEAGSYVVAPAIAADASPLPLLIPSPVRW